MILDEIENIQKKWSNLPNYGDIKDDSEIIPIETRSMSKKRNDLELNRRIKLLQFNSKKNYIFDENEGNIFFNDKNPMKYIHDLQQSEYRNLIKFLISGDLKYLKDCSFAEQPYIHWFRNGDITVNKEGFLCYHSLILLPTKARCPMIIWYHCSTPSNHRGVTAITNLFKVRFVWKGWRPDIKAVVDQCPCVTSRLPHKQNAGFKDIGIMINEVPLRQNSKLYLDLYGPNKDGDMIASIVDGFDYYVVSSSLEPLYGVTSLGIIKFVIFEWIWKLGEVDIIFTDNGKNLVGNLNKTFN